MSDIVLLNISIEATPQDIWKVLVDEQEFAACFENTKMTCNDWKVGEKIKFESQRNGETIIDEAFITSILEDERLRYNYKKQNSNHEIEVIFSLKPSGNYTYLSIESKDFADEYERSHSEIKWINMMQDIKRYVQKK